MQRNLFSILIALALVSMAVAQEPVKIGATLALSGKLGFVGLAQERGLKLACDEENQQGGINGRKLELVLEDNLGDPKTAVTGMNKLLDIDRVDLVFSALTHIVQAVKTAVARRGKLMIYAGGISEVARENQRFFRDWGDAAEHGEALALALSKHSKVALLFENNDATFEAQKSFLAKAKQQGISILGHENFDTGESDFRPMLLKLSAKKPDALMIGSWRDAALIMRQMKELGLIKIPTYHILAPFVPVNDTPEIRKLYEENSAISVWMGIVPESPEASQAGFVEKYKKRFGELPRAESAFAYDDVKILALALRACPGKQELDLTCISEKLSELRYSGVGGELYFGKNRLGTRKTVLIKVLNGKWVKIG